MGRPKKWNPHTLSTLDKEATRLFSQAWLSSSSANRVRADYRTFLHLNQLEDNEESKLYAIGQMIMAGLKMSSISTYLGYLVNNRKNAVWRATQLAHADEDSQHATDAPAIGLIRIIRAISNVPVECVVWLMFNTGARDMDLRRLRRKQITLCLAKRTVTIQFRITKGIRSRGKRRTVTFNWRTTPTPGVCEMLIDGPDDARPMLKVSVNVANSALKKADSSIARKVTTYSFRRNFINHLIDMHYDDVFSHKENLEYIAGFTMHNDPQVIEAFYKKFNKNTKKERSPPKKSRAKK